MSRSFRKTPIFGVTTARSEANDKRAWHKRWRARERAQVATVGADSDHMTVHRNAVSDTWHMVKDGKLWFGLRHQSAVADREAIERKKFEPDRLAFQRRLLAKWRSK